jgi:hypothetical protein
MRPAAGGTKFFVTNIALAASIDSTSLRSISHVVTPPSIKQKLILLS